MKISIEVRETPTAWAIRKANVPEEVRINLRSKLSVLDYMDQTEQALAYFEEGDFILLPKLKLETLKFLLKANDLKIDKIEADTEQSVKWNKIKVKPLEHQVGVIYDAVTHFQNNVDKRVCLCAKPGFGKTYMSAAMVEKLRTKFVFIVYSAKLVQQTYESYCKYLGEDGLLIMKNSRMVETVDWKSVKGLFMTHTMLQVILKDYGIAKILRMFTIEMGAGLKIIDEFDTHVKNLYWLECWGFFKYNLYLTGTKYKNLRPDDNIFQMIYRHAKTVGHNVKLPSNRHAILINYKFCPTRREWYNMHMMQEKLFKIKYNDNIARKDVLLDFIMKNYYKPEDSIIRKVVEGGDSVAIYAGRIANCEIVKNKLVNHFGINPDDIGIYNSEVNAKNKAIAETKPWIVTTTDSIGRGYDNNKLRVLIFLEFNFGISSYEQNISRVARVGGKEGWVIEGIDHSFPKIVANYKKKVKEDLYEDNYKDVVMNTVPDNYYQYYYFGYRPNEEFAEEVRKQYAKKR